MEKNKKRSRKASYENLFFKEAGTTTRSGKAVYIRKEFHDRIMKIAKIIGGDDFTLFAYLDNVLAEHFAEHQEDISNLYKERNPKDIF